MKVLVYEAACAGGLGPQPPPSLRAEGWAMLSALVEDFDRIDDIQTHTLLDHFQPGTIGHVCHRIAPSAELAEFAEVAASADLVLVIAPESGQCLAERCRWALAAKN